MKISKPIFWLIIIALIFSAGTSIYMAIENYHYKVLLKYINDELDEWIEILKRATE